MLFRSRIAQINTMDLERWSNIINTLISAGMPMFSQDWEIVRARGGLAEVEIDDLQQDTNAVLENKKTALAKLRGYLN